MDINNLSCEMQRLYKNAQKIAGRPGYMHSQLEPEHILLAFFENEDSDIYKIIETTSKKRQRYIEKAIHKDLAEMTLISQHSPALAPKASPRLKIVLKEALELGRQYGMESLVVAPETLLIAVTSSNSPELKRLRYHFQDRAVRKERIEEIWDMRRSLQESLSEGGEKDHREQDNIGVIKSPDFCVEFTTYEFVEKAGRVIGRDGELDRIVRILLRKTKNNPLIIGEPGVGKSAVVEGLAARIFQGEVPELAGCRIFSLDMGGLLAGTRYRGEFEERFKKIIDLLVKSKGNIILFIDEIHMIMGAGNIEGGADAANLLKPELARGRIRVIGATTQSEYSRYIKKDRALDRRFLIVQIDEPDQEEAIQILDGCKKSYEKHFKGISYSDKAIKAAVTLSARYISGYFLPDKAFDLLDDAGAEAIRKNISPKAESASGTDIQDRAVIEETPIVINEQEIAQVVETRTGIPVTRVSLERLGKGVEGRGLASFIDEVIIGQSHVSREIENLFIRRQQGLADPKQPIDCILFMGPTGTGKTAMTKRLAEYLFHSEDTIHRFDMSEYKNKEDASKLIGSAPGYVGFEEGGRLTEAVKFKPFSICLFDELEKAHPGIYDIMLQLLDEGRLTSGQGETVDFKNTVIIATTNIGGDISDGQILEMAGSPDKTRNFLAENWRGARIEFVNRFDKLLLFKPLGTEQMIRILDLQLSGLEERLQVRENGNPVKMIVSDDVRKILVDKCNLKFGARDIQRIVRDKIETPLAKRLVDYERGKLKSVGFGVKAGEVRIDVEG